MFHASLLAPYHETMEHGPNYEEPAPDLIDGQPEYEVELILGARHHGRWQKLQYLVQWKGYSEAHNSWVAPPTSSPNSHRNCHPRLQGGADPCDTAWSGIGGLWHSRRGST
jgi:Chromo (CHRromatin Organisation MOdifier) domain